MKKSIKKEEIKSYFNEILPNASCELNYSKDYELLIAVMLSAQTTDKKVNEVTDKLFKNYPTLESFDKASKEELFEFIKPIGLANNKVLALKDIVHKLIYDFNGKVPNNKTDLLKMKGVGVKVTNVCLIELFKIPEFPVDTHCFRVAKRLNIADLNDDITKTEAKLRSFFDEKDYIKLHHQFIHFGRYICKAQNPNCKECKIQKYCVYDGKLK